MATKFSQFTAGATTANTLVVGFDSNLNTNNKYTLGQLATGLSDFIPSFYTGDGTITSDQRRTVTIGGTSGLLFTGGPGGSFSATKVSSTYPYTAVITSTTPITTGMSISGQPGVITSVTSSGNDYTIQNSAAFNGIPPTNLTILYSNSVTIGDKAGLGGIGWKITPGVGGASAGMTIADTNGQNIIFKYANGNNPIQRTKVVSIGEQMASDVLNGKATLAVNQPNNYWNNAPWLNQNNTDTSTIWSWAGGNKNNATLIGKFGDADGSGDPDPGSDDDKIIQCMAWPGTTANSRLQRIFAASTSGLVEIGSASNGATYKAATNLKVNGQAYSVLKTGITDLTFNWNDSNIQSSTLAASTPTFTASNPKAGATYILTLAQTGAVTATWTGVKWPGDVAPVLSGANKTDVITLICYDEAANSGAGAYYGSFTLNFTT